MIGGSTVAPELSKAILEGTPEARRDARQKMTARFIRRRMDLRRLSPEERDRCNAVLQKQRDSGMEALKSFKLSWKKCPGCEAAVGGSKR
jgi:hypothetical protein